MEDALALPILLDYRRVLDVLILVVMEDALALAGNKSARDKVMGVLILVVMEDALALQST